MVKKYVEQLRLRIVTSKKLDIALVEKLARMIIADTMQHSNVREFGAEWICYSSWNKLEPTPAFLTNGTFSQFFNAEYVRYSALNT